MRLDKLLSNLKYGSRTEVKKIIRKGHVSVNGVPIFFCSFLVDPKKDVIEINGQSVIKVGKVILKLNKPAGYVSATKDPSQPVITNLLNALYQRMDLKMAGRLDKDTSGLMILTNDGDLIHRITHPKKSIDKVYEATLDQPMSEHQGDQLLMGVTITDSQKQPFLAVAKAITINANQVIITISEGKFHQIKRMFSAVGLKVISLRRTQIGNLKLADLPIGEYQEICEGDIFD